MQTSQEVGHRSDGIRSAPIGPTGADVHDHVVQQLSAVRLTLRKVNGALGGGPLADRLLDSISELDDAIEQLRDPASAPQAAPTTDTGLARRLLDVVMEATLTLDSSPRLRFTGMNLPLPEDIEADLRAVLRQALTHVGQRTAATDIDVLVSVTADRLSAQVTEYVTGAGSDSCHVDLGDLHRRARDHDGTFSVEPRQQSGTQMTWTVPLGPLHAIH